MFGFLKDKIKQTIEKFTKKADKEEVEIEKIVEEEFKKPEEKIVEEKPVLEEIKKEEKKEEAKKEEKHKEEVKIEVKKEKEHTEKPKEKIVEVKEHKEIKKEEIKIIPDHKIIQKEKEEKIIEPKKEKFVEKKIVEEIKPIIQVPIIEEVEDEIIDEVIEDELFDDDIKEEIEPEKIEEKKIISEKQNSVEEPAVMDATKKKKGFFSKIKEHFVKFKITDENFEELFWEFELELMESSVAISVIEKIKKDMKEKLTQENVSKKGIEEVIKDSLKQTFEEILSVEGFDLLKLINNRRANGQNADGSKMPFIIAIIGVNGSGKTTTIAKILKLFNDNKITSVVSASDTFRAAAIDQLEEHTTKLGVKLIKHDYNSDPAAVAFDAISHAKSKNIDVVLIDTAGRLHSNTNLMDELKKVIRVAKPDLKIFVGESITGNDCVEQATEFDSAVGIDGIILSKADVDDKGGAAISISYVTKKPILYLGTGQEYSDLVKFDKDSILKQIGL
jgi:fused signal recognition particle receptor